MTCIHHADVEREVWQIGGWTGVGHATLEHNDSSCLMKHGSSLIFNRQQLTLLKLDSTE